MVVVANWLRNRNTVVGTKGIGCTGTFPDSSLADLYDPLSMPPELLKAHRELDRAVMKLYGFSVKDTTEADCVAALMGRYRVLVGEVYFGCLACKMFRNIYIVKGNVRNY
jgi:hypothetical protein